MLILCVRAMLKFCVIVGSCVSSLLNLSALVGRCVVGLTRLSVLSHFKLAGLSFLEDEAMPSPQLTTATWAAVIRGLG